MLRYDGYLRDLTKLNTLLREHQRLGEDSLNYKLLEAGELACRSLNRLLLEDDFWQQIQREPSGEPPSPEYVDEVVLPVNSQLLGALGYEGPPSPQELISHAREAINRGLSSGKAPGEPRTRVEALKTLVCNLEGNARGLLYSHPEADGGIAESGDPRPGVWQRTKERLQVKRLVRGIKETIVVLAGAVTIATGVTGRPSEPPPEPPPPIIYQLPAGAPRCTPEVKRFWEDYYQRAIEPPDCFET